jgi:hypothetical protein
MEWAPSESIALDPPITPAVILVIVTAALAARATATVSRLSAAGIRLVMPGDFAGKQQGPAGIPPPGGRIPYSDPGGKNGHGR